MNLEVERYEGELRELRKAAEMALNALERCEYGVISNGRLKNSIETLRQTLAQPPCQTGSQCIGGKCPECEWVGLTDEEFEQAVDGLEDLRDCWIQIEAKLKEKNA